MATKDETPRFFATPDAWRAWLEKNHATKTEQWVGFYKKSGNKKSSSKKSIGWSEAVDEALCFGWIDAVRKGIDDEAYKIRFTRRKPGSVWSKVNVAKVAALTEEGKMREAGVAAYALRTDAKTGIYSFERKEPAKLPPEMQKRFEKNKKAWSWFQSKAPSYQRIALHWVVSAKREETRESRLLQLIDDSANERLIPSQRRPS